MVDPPAELALDYELRTWVFFATYFGFDPSTARRYLESVIIIRDAEGFSLALGEAQDAEHSPRFPHFGFDMHSPEGTVALAEARARWTHPIGRVSDDEGQFIEGFGKSSGRRYVDFEIVEASAEVLGRRHGRRR